MAENDSTKTPIQPSRRTSLTPSNKSLPSKASESLTVNYTIEKTSGLRISKKLNSFKVSSGSSLKSMINLALKKIKFSTRYKYVTLYFDTKKNSKKYLEWRKFKDRIEFQYGDPIRMKVCRMKATNRPLPEKNEPSPAANTTFINPSTAPMQLSPAFAAMFYTYLNYMQYARLQSMGML